MTSPFGPLLVIANPHAARGRVGAELPELERQLQVRRLAYDIRTVAPGDAAGAAREALDGGVRFLVACGGDETVHEVVNGMLEDDRPVAGDAVLGVVAAGSEADFGRTFGLPGDVVRAVRHLTGDRTYAIDAGKVTCVRDGAEVTRYFANVAQAGFGAAVAGRAARMPRVLGRGRRFAGFWLELARHRPVRITVHADRKTFEAEGTNVVIANGQFTGGGMRVSPRSYPGDGLFDVQVSIGPRSEAFTSLPKVYRGEHVPSPTIKELRGRLVRVDAARPLAVEADGQPLGETPAVFEVLHEALRLKI